ncbi:MAG: penicillin-binding protein 2 [Armatimonadota bacterium]
MGHNRMNGPTNSRFRTASNVFANGMRFSQSATASTSGPPESSNGVITRIVLLGTLILVGFVALVIKLWQLQFFDYDKYLESAISNTLKHARATPPRGEITDSQHNLLATTTSKYVIAVVPGWLPKKKPEPTPNGPTTLPMVWKRLARACEVDQKRIEENYKAVSGGPKYEPVAIMQSVSQRIATRVLENIDTMPGVIVQVVPMRRYPDGNLFTSILGYTSPVSEQDLKNTEIRLRYKASDFIGRGGIERFYDQSLAGAPGDEEFATDRTSGQRRTVNVIPPQPGNRIVLSIDNKLQRIAAQSLGKRKGAVVAIEPSTGKVLAFVSSPTYDLNLWNVRPMPKRTYDINIKPYATNQATQAQLPPGSVMKIVTLTAALETGKVTPGTAVRCDGGLRIGKRSFLGCTGNHGYVTMMDAFAVSCNAYFGQLGIWVGQEELEKWSRRFGLGMDTGIDLTSESDGNIDGPKSQEAIYRHYKKPYEGWFSGDSANMAIGQGAMLTTPLQMASLAATVANNGNRIVPHILDHIEPANPSEMKVQQPDGLGKVVGSVGWSERTRLLVQQAMNGVITNRRGTGQVCRLPGIDVFGKTGSAESRGKRSPTHAWFAGYAQRNGEQPRIAFAVWLDADGKHLHGGEHAAPIARQLIAHIYGIKVNPLPIPQAASND